MTKEEKEKLLKQAEEHFDYLLEYSDGGDFIQVVGSMGGDIRTYRFYSNGLITER